MKNKICNRSRRENNPDTNIEHQETMLELKLKGYHGIGQCRGERTPQTMDSGGNIHKQIPESSGKGLKVNHMVDPTYAKKKRESTISTDKVLKNGNSQFEHDGETITESLGESKTSSRHYYTDYLKQDKRYAIDIISNNDTISIASNSYEMIEYGLNRHEIEAQEDVTKKELSLQTFRCYLQWKRRLRIHQHLSRRIHG